MLVGRLHFSNQIHAYLPKHQPNTFPDVSLSETLVYIVTVTFSLIDE